MCIKILNSNILTIAHDNLKLQDPRLDTGYEAVPTRDIHMKQVGLQKVWLEFLRLFVSRLQEHVYLGYYSDGVSCFLLLIIY